jgi:hypothetical protein
LGAYYLYCDRLVYKAFQQTDNPMEEAAISTPPSYEELYQLLQEQRRIAEEQRQQLQEERRIAEEQRQLREGTYYSSIDDVWAVEAVGYTVSDWEALRRLRSPSLYTETVTAAQVAENRPRDETSLSRSSLSVFSPHRTRPVDIFGIRESGDIAHLLPASATNASLYDDVAAWTLALPAGTDRLVLQKCIHGSVSPPGNRITGTGLKHSVFNKIRLDGQAKFHDKLPCIMIVPVMTLDEVKGWNGGGYDALVMAGPYDETRTRITSVCIGMGEGMLKRGDIATVEETEVARCMLKQVVCGLAYSLIRERADLTDVQQTALEVLRRDLSIQAPETLGLRVPNLTNQNLHVRKVTFSGQNDEGHPAPDPLLLTVKAAINWSWRHGQKLLAGGELSDDDEASELSALAEEQYLEWQRERLRPKNRQDLAQGLGQPNGYQNVTKAN